MDERRLRDPSIREWLMSLNEMQKIAANGIETVGYELSFIRGRGDAALAVYVCDDNVATIDCDGEINFNPDIDLR
ncbi:hypothetical protein C2869_18460 [Saccharobesus litoralis]|uniref:Uncharacterized protein n=1 Tax=Saccharobesus litoralis TaxID=2172099 RepID=A0A2S0VVM3_9ALTE|nr:hypothetical protein [Saccharobesus litoralis]AWB68274.1 hypothetical protein C2869_18460 [Saccharobesus litoralis]